MKYLETVPVQPHTAGEEWMIDIDKFKLLLAEGNKQREEHARLVREAKLATGFGNLKNRREVERMLRPLLTNAGFDVDELNKLLAQQQIERRQNFEKQQSDAADHSAADREAFHRSIEEGFQASEYLKNLPFDTGGLASLITLPTPFLIWEWPHLDQSLVRGQLEPLKSFAKFLLNVPAYSFDNDNGSGETEVSFYFLWENESDYIAIVKCFSVVGLNGSCDLEANNGILSGDTMTLSMDAWLYPVSYWLPLPPGGNITNLRMQGDPLQHQQILYNLTATGGYIFGDAGSAGKIFSNASYGMSYGQYGGISIPGRATALFEVNVKFSYSWDGNTLPDQIKADFADDRKNYSIECPLVVLQLLTAPPKA
jgi:hypothetical protein